MELQEILSVAIGTLTVVVIAHFAVFWVVRTMYPPVMVVTQQQAPQPAYTPPPVVTQAQEPVQHATLPTYETPLPMEPARESGEKPQGPPPAESTSIRRDPGMVASNPQ